MTATTAVLPAAPPDPLVLQRDDGPLARALGGVIDAAPHAVPLLVAGIAPIIATVAVAGAGAPRGLVAAELAWLIVCGSASAGAPARGRLRWAAPPLVRIGEYASLIWIAALAGAAPAAFALLAALAFGRYEPIYRLSQRRATPPAWVKTVSLGWEGRLILGFLLLLAGALPAGWYAWAAVLGLVLVGEASAGWLRADATATAGEEDDAEEGAL